MSTGQPGNMFGALRVALKTLREQLEATPGAKILAMGRAQGTLPDVVRGALDLIEKALRPLHDLIAKVAPCVDSADAAVAMMEVATDTLRPLGPILSKDLADALELPRLRSIGQTLDDGVREADKFLDAASFLPSPEDIRSIQGELERLLGDTAATPRSLPRLRLALSLSQGKTKP